MSVWINDTSWKKPLFSFLRKEVFLFLYGCNMNPIERFLQFDFCKIHFTLGLHVFQAAFSNLFCMFGTFYINFIGPLTGQSQNGRFRLSHFQKPIGNGSISFFPILPNAEWPYSKCRYISFMSC